jgi:hypothetical protein
VPDRKVLILRTAAQNNAHALIPGCLDDGSDTLFDDALERVRVTTWGYRVHRDRHTAVRAILEVDWEEHPRGKFPVKLGFGSAGADCTPRNGIITIIEVLWGDSLRSLEPAGIIYSRIVDEAIPTELSCAVSDEER